MSQEPQVVSAARRTLTRASLGLTAAVTGGSFAAAAAVFAALDAGPAFAVGAVAFGAVALAGALVARREGGQRALRAAQNVIGEWERRQAAAEVDAAHGPVRRVEDPRSAAWPPIRDLLTRVAALATGDARISAIAESVEARLRRLHLDLEALDAGLDAEQALGDTARLDRLREARATREAAADRLLEGLRDLHVELTVQQGDAECGASAALSDLLASLSAEAEVAGVQGGRLAREAPHAGAPRARREGERERG